MKPDWITRTIGRHLVDLPASAKLYETYTFNKVKIEPLPIKNRQHFDHIVNMREAELKKAEHDKHGSMFIERVKHANGSATLVSWSDSASEDGYYFDTYFLAGTKAIKYSGHVGQDRKSSALKLRNELSQEWRERNSGEIPEGVGFVTGDVILIDKAFNLEDWSLSAQFAGKPEVNFVMYGFARRVVKPGLRERAGGAKGFLAGVLAGKSTLRSRVRSVGPIEGDEILMAATQNGRRSYGFKWEAPGKASSLAEPYLIAELTDGIQDPEAAGPTSFRDDDEALALWDEIIDSIRLRPGAAG
ncbi:MAG: hypothetical protein CVU18_03570 [Betaproteobacteria bacterium HGW-Betaproteobacteria-12]|nr:MAG: hypothetical protein CVU18_03570 [Betaproteobacteria bacterium HGW-Betaproteobacteria-12]